MDKFILREWLKCGYIDREFKTMHEIKSGVPQGGIVSPTNAILY